MVTIESNYRQWEKLFKNLLPDAAKKISARVLNNLGRMAFVRQGKNVKTRLTLRDEKFALRSLKMYKATESRPIEKQDAVVGTFSKYLWVSDQGGPVYSKRKGSMLLPTPASRGGDMDARPILNRYRVDKLGEFSSSAKKVRTKGAPFVLRGRGRRGAVYVRKSKRKIMKIRVIGPKKVKLRPVRWHTDAIQSVWRPEVINPMYTKVAERLYAEAISKAGL